MVDDGRMNVAGLSRENLEYFARSIAAVLGKPDGAPT
jgi:aspartate/tyrosine/aromatic aminotransferase